MVIPTESLRTNFKRFCVVVIFGIAFAYIEAAVVVYLRTIFHPSGFSFPLTEFGLSPLWKRLLLTETGREAATILIILTGSWLSGRTFHQRLAFFLTIFAIWDIFYYIWLKVLINWPASLMDWDILFLIPTVWAGPVAAPVIVSLIMLVFAVIILYRDCRGNPPKATLFDQLVFIFAAIFTIVSFCIAGLHAAQPDFKSHFYWSLFAVGPLSAVLIFAKCLFKSR
jgi:hypothetical protein